MRECKKDVTPMRYRWSYVFLALTHRYIDLQVTWLLPPIDREWKTNKNITGKYLISNIGLIMVYGLNESHIAPDTDIEFQLTKY